MRNPLALVVLAVLLLSALLSWLANSGVAVEQAVDRAEPWQLTALEPPHELEPALRRLSQSGFLGADEGASIQAETVVDEPGTQATTPWSLVGTVRDAAGPRAIISLEGRVRQIGEGETIGTETRILSVTENSIIIEENEQQRTVRLFDAP